MRERHIYTIGSKIPEAEHFLCKQRAHCLAALAIVKRKRNQRFWSKNRNGEPMFVSQPFPARADLCADLPKVGRDIMRLNFFDSRKRGSRPNPFCPKGTADKCLLRCFHYRAPPDNSGNGETIAHSFCKNGNVRFNTIHEMRPAYRDAPTHGNLIKN